MLRMAAPRVRRLVPLQCGGAAASVLAGVAMPAEGGRGAGLLLTLRAKTGGRRHRQVRFEDAQPIVIRGGIVTEADAAFMRQQGGAVQRSRRGGNASRRLRLPSGDALAEAGVGRLPWLPRLPDPLDSLGITMARNAQETESELNALRRRLKAAEAAAALLPPGPTPAASSRDAGDAASPPQDASDGDSTGDEDRRSAVLAAAELEGLRAELAVLEARAESSRKSRQEHKRPGWAGRHRSLEGRREESSEGRWAPLPPATRLGATRWELRSWESPGDGAGQSRRQQSRGFAETAGGSSSSSSGGAGGGFDGEPEHQPPWWDRPKRWARRKVAEAELAAQEWQERAMEWRDGLWQRIVALLHDAPRYAREQQMRSDGLALNAFMERMHAKWLAANQRLDDRFNAQWPLMQAELERQWHRLRHGRGAASVQRHIPAFDTPAVMLIGAGTGIALHGFTGAGMVLGLSGCVRGVSRFVLRKVDTEDVRGLFRWVPQCVLDAGMRKRIFDRLRLERQSFHRLRDGGVDFSWIDDGSDSSENRARRDAMDPLKDYTPERLFEDAMASVVAHPRVQEVLGKNVRPAAEPEKVVYRIVEGIAEVYLAWGVFGDESGAEVQVKSTASCVDFIYIFPDSRGRYGVAPPGFVIRPKGRWSKNIDELPRYMKQPFGEKGDSERMFHNRTGVFDGDWAVRDFRHGKEERRRRGFKMW